jgi:ribonucleotide reductase alpha subunit
MWGLNPDDLFYDDWADIKGQIVTYGLRNSLLVALMPTASSATIMGVTEAFEIQTSNVYSRKTLSGEFSVVNRYLIQDLVELGLWNQTMIDDIIRNEGSIQSIQSIPDNIKKRYRTVWEISQSVVIDMAADRGPFICQTQSMNLFLAKPTVPKLSSMYLYAHSKGLKTLCYYLRRRATSEAVQFTIGKNDTCESCSA